MQSSGLWVCSWRRASPLRPYPFKVFKGCLPEILLGPYLYTTFLKFLQIQMDVQYPIRNIPLFYAHWQIDKTNKTMLISEYWGTTPHFSSKITLIFVNPPVSHHFGTLCIKGLKARTADTQPAITCSELTTEALEQAVKYVQSSSVFNTYFTTCSSVSAANFEHAFRGV